MWGQLSVTDPTAGPPFTKRVMKAICLNLTLALCLALPLAAFAQSSRSTSGHGE